MAYGKFELKTCPNHFSQVPVADNYYAALNSAVFSDGSFVFIPKGVKSPMEISTYFRINASETGQVGTLRQQTVCERSLYPALDGPVCLLLAVTRRFLAGCGGYLPEQGVSRREM